MRRPRSRPDTGGSSRTVPGTPITEGCDFPLSTYADSCTRPNSTVLGVIANVGALRDPSATLDTYVDNITAGGDTYDFAVDRRATAAMELSRSTGSRNARTIEGTVIFTSPPQAPTCGAPAPGSRSPPTAATPSTPQPWN